MAPAYSDIVRTLAHAKRIAHTSEPAAKEKD